MTPKTRNKKKLSSKKSNKVNNKVSSLGTSLNKDVQKYMSNMGQMQFASDFKDFGLIPKELGINRPLKKDHVSTLSTILSNGSNLWHPIFVCENKFKIKSNNISGKIMKFLNDNLDGTYSIIDSDGNIPKYIIIDGQHRFEAFKNKNTSFPYYDSTNVNNIDYLDEIIEFVNNFNIGMNSYNYAMVRAKSSHTSPYLEYFKKITKKTKITQKVDRNIRKPEERHEKTNITIYMDDKKCPYKVSFINKTIRGQLKKEVDNHVKNKYRTNTKLSKELKEHMDNALLVFKMINEISEGYTPHQSTLYKFIGNLMYNITFQNISFKDFINKLTEHFISERNIFKSSNNINLDKRIHLQELTDELFGNMSKQVLRMLSTYNIPYSYDNNKNKFII